MNIRFETGDIFQADCDLLVFFGGASGVQALSGSPADAPAKPPHSCAILPTAKARAGVLMQVHLDFYANQPPAMRVRSAIGDAMRLIVQRGAASIAISLEETQLDEFDAILDGLFAAAYSFQTYCKAPSTFLDKLDIAIHIKDAYAARARGIFERAGAVNAGVNAARDLANLPPAKVTPEFLAGSLAEVAERYGAAVKTYEYEELLEKGYVGHTAVGGGSVHSPCMAVAHYVPKSGSANGRVIALVGKGITFDSGGIDLKPFEDMWLMKADMSGAAAVVGAFDAICVLKPQVEVYAIACCAENLPSGSAYRPSDILTYRNGKSVEIISTDAEGRLVLADGLIHACELGATHIVDVATLTGACVIALGHDFTGLFGNDEAFEKLVEAAAESSGELVWRLPLPAWYYDAYLKSDFCDFKNVGGRMGGAITAAVFLNEFVEKGRAWCHLDIAPTFYVDKSKREFLQPGATGAGVRLLVEIVGSLAEK